MDSIPKGNSKAESLLEKAMPVQKGKPKQLPPEEVEQLKQRFQQEAREERLQKGKEVILLNGALLIDLAGQHLQSNYVIEFTDHRGVLHQIYEETPKQKEVRPRQGNFAPICLTEKATRVVWILHWYAEEISTILVPYWNAPAPPRWRWSRCIVSRTFLITPELNNNEIRKLYLRLFHGSPDRGMGWVGLGKFGYLAKKELLQYCNILLRLTCIEIKTSFSHWMKNQGI